MKVTMTPAEIRAFAEKVKAAYISNFLDGQEGGVITMKADDLCEEIFDSVTIACVLDRIAAEHDLVMAAADCLEGVEEEEE